jgi:hypothetical protein
LGAEHLLKPPYLQQNIDKMQQQKGNDFISVRTWTDWSSKVLNLYHHCIRLNQMESKPLK